MAGLPCRPDDMASQAESGPWAEEVACGQAEVVQSLIQVHRPALCYSSGLWGQKNEHHCLRVKPILKRNSIVREFYVSLVVLWVQSCSGINKRDEPLALLPSRADETAQVRVGHLGQERHSATLDLLTN